MKCKVAQNELAKALKACEKSFLVRANLPVLSNILLTISKNSLEALSTNLETATRVAVPCQGEIDGRITLPGRVFMDFIWQLPEQTLAIELLGEEVLVTTKGYSARFASMPAEEFPAIPKIESGKKIEIEASVFAKACAQVVFCAAQDEGRPTLNGILCELNKQNFSMVATDGYRLGFVTIPIAGSASLIKMIIPAKTLGEVIKLASELEQEEDGKSLTITIADTLTQANFKLGNIEFTSRLIEGEFPNWQKIIPANFATSAKILREELTRRVRIAAVFARDSGNIVRLKLEGKKLTILATTAQVGSNETEMEAEISGKGGEIAFNYRYILEALSAIDSEVINFQMSESLTPGRITPEDTKSGLFQIIMPVRLQG